MTDPSSACHAEGRGFESLQPLSKRPAFTGLFSGRSRLVRLRHRTMTGQSCPRRLASAVGRRSLAGDSERPAPWNFCVPSDDRDRPRRVGAPAPPAPLRLVRGRNAAFVEEQHFPGRASSMRNPEAARVALNKRMKRTTSPGSHPPKRVRGPRVRAGGPSTGQAGSPCRRGRGTGSLPSSKSAGPRLACLATPAEVVNNEDTLAVELAVFLSLD